MMAFRDVKSRLRGLIYSWRNHERVLDVTPQNMSSALQADGYAHLGLDD